MKPLIFRVNTTLKSYAFPVIKILICLTVLFLLINRNHFFYIIENIEWVDILVGVFCVCLGIVCILCIYTSFAEIIVVYDKQSGRDFKKKTLLKKAETLTIENILSLVDQNDIIEIWIINGEIVKIGSSADSKNGSSCFINKCYYIGDKDYSTIDDFKNSLIEYSDNGKIRVATIDGLSPRLYRWMSPEK